MKKKAVKGVTILNIVLLFAIVFFSLFGSTSLFSIAGKQFSLSFYLSAIALPLFYICYFFVYENRFVDFLIKAILPLFCVLFISSLGMAFILKPICGTLYSQTPTKVVIVNAIKYAYDLAMIPYFAFFLGSIKKKWIIYFVNVLLVLWVLFGCFQFLAFSLNNPILWEIYDGIDVLKIISGNSEMLGRIRLNYGSFRFFGFASEPASNTLLFSIFLTPFLAQKIFFDKCEKKLSRIFYIVAAIFSAFFLYLTKSASVYFCFAIEIFVLVLLGEPWKKMNKTTWLMLASGFVGIMVILICIPGSRYVLIDRFFLKIIDISDASTQHRYSTIWNDLLILIKFPIFGIGDGNQGFFYAYHVSGTWMARNLETQAAIKGELGLLNGGAAIPSFISGFGVFGLAALFVTIKRIFAKTKDRPALSSSNRIYYVAGVVTLFFALFVSNGFHRTYLVYLFLTSYFLLTNIDDNKISWMHAIMSRHDYGNCSCDQIEI